MQSEPGTKTASSKCPSSRWVVILYDYRTYVSHVYGTTVTCSMGSKGCQGDKVYRGYTCKGSRQVTRHLANLVISDNLAYLIHCRMDPAGYTRHLYTAGCQDPPSGSPDWPAADR